VNYYVYILKSKKTGKYYIGQTQDIEKRIIYHNSGYNKSTKPGRPLELVYKKEFNTRSEFVKYESKLKRMKSHSFIENLLQH
jgi:putative endonuclease